MFSLCVRTITLTPVEKSSIVGDRLHKLDPNLSEFCPKIHHLSRISGSM